MVKLSQRMKKVVSQTTKAKPADVTFKLAADAASVFVVGEFNNWVADDTSRLERTNGCFSRALNLKPGSYRYRFVVDGKWQEDPSNPLFAENPFGERDSILEIKS
jgi:1,4-alpha-glucan branching enzyme